MFGFSLEEFHKILEQRSPERITNINNIISAVVKINMEWHPKNDDCGTGFIVGKEQPFLITCFHVLPDKKTIDKANVVFDYNSNAEHSKEVSNFAEKVLYSNSLIDFIVISLKTQEMKGVTKINLSDHKNHEISPNAFINLVHHPICYPKRILFQEAIIDHEKKLRNLLALEGNLKARKKLLQMYDNGILFGYHLKNSEASCTIGGSSGAPIFNEDWKIIGIHQGQPESIKNNWIGPSGVNIGISINSLVKSIPRKIRRKIL